MGIRIYRQDPGTSVAGTVGVLSTVAPQMATHAKVFYKDLDGAVR